MGWLKQWTQQFDRQLHLFASSRLHSPYDIQDMHGLFMRAQSLKQQKLTIQQRTQIVRKAIKEYNNIGKQFIKQQKIKKIQDQIKKINMNEEINTNYLDSLTKTNLQIKRQERQLKQQQQQSNSLLGKAKQSFNYIQNIASGLIQSPFGALQGGLRASSGISSLGTSVLNAVRLQPMQSIYNFGSGVSDVVGGSLQLLGNTGQMTGSYLPIVAGVGAAMYGISKFRQSNMYNKWKNKNAQQDVTKFAAKIFAEQAEQKFTNAINGITNYSGEAVNKFGNKVGDKVKKYVNAIGNQIQDFSGQLIDKGQKTIQRNTKKIKQQVLSGIDRGINSVEQKASQIWKKIRNKNLEGKLNQNRKHKSDQLQEQIKVGQKPKQRQAGMLLNVEHNQHPIPQQLRLIQHKNRLKRQEIANKYNW